MKKCRTKLHVRKVLDHSLRCKNFLKSNNFDFFERRKLVQVRWLMSVKMMLEKLDVDQNLSELWVIRVKVFGNMKYNNEIWNF